MPGQTHVTDTAYHYDGTFAGFLCCIFESYARREIPADVCPPQQAQLTLYGVRDIATDAAHARRVAAGLGRLGPAVRDRIATGFLHSTVPGKDLALLRFARLAFARGPQAAQMLGDADAAEAFALERAVLGEAHHYIEFCGLRSAAACWAPSSTPSTVCCRCCAATFAAACPTRIF